MGKNKYGQLHDLDDDEKPFEAKSFEIGATAKTHAKKGGNIMLASGSAVVSAAGVAIGPVNPVSVVGNAVSYRSAISSRQHWVALRALKGQPATPASIASPCNCGECDNIIDYIVGKKKKKARRKAIAAIPVVPLGLVVKAGTGVKSAYKRVMHTRGQNRLEMAYILHRKMRDGGDGGGCRRAIAIVSQVCGEDEAKKIKNLKPDDAAQAIAKKLVSI